VAISDGEFQGGSSDEEVAVAALDVEDVKAEADRLRDAGVNIGVVIEIPGTIRLLDVFDPDGNRLQLTEEI
jgi:transaldolase